MKTLDYSTPMIAYFTPEVAIDNDLHFYAGGQGIVAGATLKAAAKMELPMIGVSNLWRCGYYDQILGKDGMEVYDVARDYKDVLVDTGVKVKVQVAGNPNVWIKIWLLKPEIFQTVPIIFLDTDVEENDHLSRTITQAVYRGPTNRRLAQRIVLGIGGVRTLQALGIPVRLYHLNEGETFEVAIELLNQKMSEGLSFEESLRLVRELIVSTIHTPELSGNQSFPISLMKGVGCLLDLNEQQAAFLGGGDPFQPTIVLLKTSKIANAVSRLHCQTANQTFAGAKDICQIIPVTNGVVDDFWQPLEFRGNKTPEEIRKAKLHYTKELFDLVKEQTNKVFQEDVLTIAEARRWAEYKRLDLIFNDMAWLEPHLRSDRLQLILAGKPHPDDWEMINLWNKYWKMSQDLPNVAVLTGYELNMMKLLRLGVHAWLNTPRRPQEACGTSGMTAAAVGTMPVSIKDGWVIEGNIGFLCGVDCPCKSKEEQDRLDAEDLKKCIEEMIETFYKKRGEWDSKILVAKKVVERDYTAERMLRNYISQLYNG